jgi:uncharacterized protein (DUF433 family)
MTVARSSTELPAPPAPIMSARARTDTKAFKRLQKAIGDVHFASVQAIAELSSNFLHNGFGIRPNRLKTGPQSVNSKQAVVPQLTVKPVGRAESVDRGRGPQLSTCRITVQDLVPYLQQNCTYEDIMAIMPVLTREEIQAIEQYVRDNYEAVMDQDRRIRERTANRTTPPEIQEIRKKGHAKALALMEQFAKNKAQEKNGDYSSR